MHARVDISMYAYKTLTSLVYHFSFIYLSFSGFANAQSTNLPNDRYHVTYLNGNGQPFECCKRPHSSPIPKLEIFCYMGKPKDWVHLWETVTLDVDLSLEEYEYYEGSTPEQTFAEYEEHRSSWSFNLFTWKEKTVVLNPFNSSCVGVNSSNSSYKVILKVIRLDFWKALLLLSGIVLYILSPKLSDNPLFYYICGISLGICTSLLVLVYLISKLIPKRPMMYGFVIGGWTIGVYMIQMLWENIRLIALQHQSKVLIYVTVTGLISFIVCYRMGPVTNPKSKNLIKWALQSGSLCLMYLSSAYHEAAIALMLVFLTFWHFPLVWRATIKSYWSKHFPPTVRNLTHEEYYLQGIKATNEGIEELRRYCASPECDAWKTVRRLKDPMRFAKFMAGTSHLSDDELLNYEVNDSEDITNTYYSVTDDDSCSD